MFTRTRYLILLLMLMALPVMGTLAQGAPEQINAALTDLSTRVGTPVTLAMLDNWTWQQELYTDTSLGCPQEGQVYTQVQVVGYQFDLTYVGVVYDYRVAADSSIVVLCSQTPLNEVPTETPDQAVEGAFSNPLCPPPPAGMVYPLTRLKVGIQARVTPGLPNRVRAEPDAEAGLLGEIPGGGIFNVVAGPSCDETGLVWWQVNFDGLVGWTIEGINNEYVLEPLPPLPLPAELQPITTENANLLAEVARLQGNYTPGLGWSFSTETDAPPRLVALGGAGSEGAWIYELVALDQAPRLLPGTNRLTAVAFSPDPNLALFGSENGSIRLWDIAPGAPLVERAFLQSQTSPVRAVAFSPDGLRLAAAGGQAIGLGTQEENLYAIALWDVATVSQGLLLRGHTDEVNALAFSASNLLLFSGSADGTVRMWDVARGETINTIEFGFPVISMAVNPTEDIIAVTLDNADIVLVSAASGETITTLVPVQVANSIAFSPDGGLLVSGMDDGTVLVWNISTPDVEPEVLSGHSERVMTVLVSPDGRLIVSQAEDNTIRLWAISNNAVG